MERGGGKEGGMERGGARKRPLSIYSMCRCA